MFFHFYTFTRPYFPMSTNKKLHTLSSGKKLPEIIATKCSTVLVVVKCSPMLMFYIENLVIKNNVFHVTNAVQVHMLVSGR